MSKRVGTLRQAAPWFYLAYENNRSIHCWLLIATAAWAQIDKASDIVWLPNSIGTLNGKGYQMGLRHDGVVVWRWSPYH